MNSIMVQAPAKVNLTLQILDKRDDGYHTVDMVMQTVDLTDTVTVSHADTLTVTADIANLTVDTDNTACKAVDLFCKAVHIPPHFAVHLQKRIPMQAGLAGGSADAAGTLFALNVLCGTPLSLDALCDIAANIGADVPFCLRGGTMRATAIGTTLTPLPAIPSCYMVIAKPPIGISTGAAYAAVDAHPFDNAVNTAMYDALAAGDITAIGAAMKNRFSETNPLPEIETLCAILREHGALGACMSGSGSAVVGVFADLENAKHALTAVQPLCEMSCVTTPWRDGIKIV